jgi:pimeloyl-ACP methyl ester carboxylesterase
MDTSTHPVEVVKAYEEVLKESAVEGRYIEIDGGRKIHVIEAGTGPPLIIQHGSSGGGYPLVPLMQHLDGVRAIAPDRPGNGLSDPVDIGRNGFRDWAVEVMDQILDALGVDQASLAGASGGGVWVIWYALAYPERVPRLILLDGVPSLPGTYCPFPTRLMATPIIGDIIARIPVNDKRVVDFMGMVGEKETIIKYPKIIEALAAENNDSVSSKASRTEMSALVNLLGWRKKMRIRSEDLAQLTMPTLMIWGEWEPMGGADVAQGISEKIPNSVLEMLPAGHVPWFGHPEKTAKLIQDFVLSR